MSSQMQTPATAAMQRAANCYATGPRPCTLSAAAASISYFVGCCCVIFCGVKEKKKGSVEDTGLDCQQQADVGETLSAGGRQSSHNTGPVWSCHVSMLHKPMLSMLRYLINLFRGRRNKLKVKCVKILKEERRHHGYISVFYSSSPSQACQ